MEVRLGGGNVNKEIIDIFKLRDYEGLNLEVTMQIKKIVYV